MKTCENCGTVDFVTKHHEEVGKTICLCRPCHDKIHDIEEKDKIKNAKRRIRKANRRIRRDLAVIEEAKRILETNKNEM